MIYLATICLLPFTRLTPVLPTPTVQTHNRRDTRPCVSTWWIYQKPVVIYLATICLLPFTRLTPVLPTPTVQTHGNRKGTRQHRDTRPCVSTWWIYQKPVVIYLATICLLPFTRLTPVLPTPTVETHNRRDTRQRRDTRPCVSTWWIYQKPVVIYLATICLLPFTRLTPVLPTPTVQTHGNRKGTRQHRDTRPCVSTWWIYQKPVVIYLATICLLPFTRLTLVLPTPTVQTHNRTDTQPYRHTTVQTHNRRDTRPCVSTWCTGKYSKGFCSMFQQDLLIL